MDRVLELDLDAATKLVVGNYVNQLHLIQLVVPGMLERGSGRVVNMASATATMDPPAPAGEGGWGLGYGASKAAFLRVAGQLHVEFASQGLVAFNVDPGFTTNDKPSDEQFSHAVPRRATRGHRRGNRVALLVDDAIEHAGTLVYSQPPVQADAAARRMAARMSTTTPKTMTAYQLVGVGRAARVPRDRRPGAGRDEVLIKVAGVGLCHSDFLFLDTPPGIIPWALPFTLGHESAGWVEQLGDGVDDLELGQPVAVAGIHSCGRCEFCLRGQDNYCPRGASGRGYGEDGGLAQYLVVPAARARAAAHARPPPGRAAHRRRRDVVPRGEARAAEARARFHRGRDRRRWARLVRGAVPPPPHRRAGDRGRPRPAAPRPRTASSARTTRSSPTTRRRRASASSPADSARPRCSTSSETTRPCAWRWRARRRSAPSRIVGAGGGTAKVSWGVLPLECDLWIPMAASIADLHEVIALAEAGELRVEVELFDVRATRRDAYERFRRRRPREPGGGHPQRLSKPLAPYTVCARGPARGPATRGEGDRPHRAHRRWS